jgi:hypothetical protein
MEVKKTLDAKVEPAINMVVYGGPGVGKTSFAAGTEKVLIGDAEGGAVFLGLHGIEADYVSLGKWSDLDELYKLAKDGGYKTVVLDPLGELLDKLIAQLKTEGYGTGRGDNVVLSLPGWGVAKDRFKAMVRKFRDLSCNLVLVAHSNEKKDEEMTTVRPKLQASLDEDVCAMVHVVGFMKSVAGPDKKPVRRLFLHPTEKYYAKDRLGVLPPHLDNAKFDDVRNLLLANAQYVKMITHEHKENNFLPQ